MNKREFQEWVIRQDNRAAGWVNKHPFRGGMAMGAVLAVPTALALKEPYMLVLIPAAGILAMVGKACGPDSNINR